MMITMIISMMIMSINKNLVGWPKGIWRPGGLASTYWTADNIIIIIIIFSIDIIIASVIVREV